MEGVLIGRSCSVGYLEACPALGGVVIEINIRGFVEAIMDRLGRGGIEEVVDISEAGNRDLSIDLVVASGMWQGAEG